MNNLKVFVLDDEPMIREAYKYLLKKDLPSFEMRECGDGDKALAMVDDFMPDIVITDVEHPGLDGITFVKMVRQKHPQLPIVVATASGLVEKVREALEAGTNEYMLKPVDPGDFMRRIKELLAGSGAMGMAISESQGPHRIKE